jgi:SAM-dependent methyltransferase
MILANLLRDVFRRREARELHFDDGSAANARCVLNVGGGSKQIPIPEHYKGWKHLLLDIDPAGGPDVICDARNLVSLGADKFDAIYCSHNLEHYYKHDVDKVLRGFLHVLRPSGFAEIRVPDVKAVMERVVNASMDIEDVLYESPGGPISVRDVIYGWSKKIESSGVDFYAHKTGFTPTSLRDVVRKAGFATIFIAERTDVFELCALAFKREPSDGQKAVLGILL